MLCDNAPCHDHAELQLSNTRIAFLPPNVTTLLQPLDQGIIQSAKAHYRTQLIRQLVITVENNGTFDQFAKNMDILTAIFMIKRAFFLVTSQTITNCFKKAGFIHSINYEPESEELLSGCDQNFVTSETFEALVSVDEELECFGELTDAEICDQIQENSTTEELENEAEIMVLPEEISSKAALEMVQKLRWYFLQKTDEVEVLGSLDKLDYSVETGGKTKQAKITDFFQ